MSCLTGKDIAEIARLLDESNFGSLDLQMGEFRLRIRRDGGGGNWSADEADEDETEESPPSHASAQVTKPTAGPAADEVDVPAPLLGNFYVQPRPGEPPFVELGTKVGPDTTIAIIEVMKLMNPIRAGVSGTVVAILAENGKPVEQGQALIRVKVDG